MQAHTSEYSISIGEFGGWTDGHGAGVMDRLDETAIAEVKEAVRESVRTALAVMEDVPWTLDLHTISLLNGKRPMRNAHTPLSKKIHHAALAGWLASANEVLRRKQKPMLFSAETPTIDYRCCAFRNGEWHACATTSLRIGEESDSAEPWQVIKEVTCMGKAVEVVVPIQIEASWACLLDPDDGHGGGTPPPSGSSQLPDGN